MPGQVDLAVVEAGLGGATDATNIFPPDNLRLAVITALGLEHEAALGMTCNCCAIHLLRQPGLVEVSHHACHLWSEGRAQPCS